MIATVAVDTVAPQITIDNQESDGTNSSLAKLGDEVIIRFTSDEPVSSVWIDNDGDDARRYEASFVSKNDNEYVYSYTVIAGDYSTQTDKVIIVARDAAGNETIEEANALVTISTAPILVSTTPGIIRSTTFTDSSVWQYSLDGVTWSEELTGQYLYLSEKPTTNQVILREVYADGTLSLNSDPFTVSTIVQTAINKNIIKVGADSHEVFVGSTADDRVIGNGGQDIFSNFAAADTFLGGTTGIVQIKQSNYLHDKGNGDYLHIEQITAADLNDAIGPQMAGYEAVVDTTPGLRLIDNVVNPLTGEQTVNTGFAQVGRIQLIGDTGLIADTMDIKAIAEAGINKIGLQLSNQAHRLLAGMGDDVILGGSNTDVLVGNGGNDWLGGGAGNDILAAGSGAIASSGSDPENIFGNVGSTYVSTIIGGDGNDTLVAIEGAVTATGGTGADVFAFYGAQAGLQTHFTITDFEIGADRIDVSRLGLGISADDLTAYFEDYLELHAVSDDSVRFDLSELTSDITDSIIVTLTGVTVADLADATIADVLITEHLNDDEELVEPSWFTQIEPLVKDEIKPVIVVDLSDETLIDTIVQGGQDEESEPLTEVFVGSSADDRVIGNGGQDIFSNFAAADTFLGGTTGIVQIKQSNYLHDKGNGDYLHIEQITAADLNDAIGPQMAGYEAVVDTTPGLRLIDGEDVVGFAQAKTIQVVAPIAEDSETYAVIDTLSVGVIEDELGNDLVGLRLFKDVPSENDKAHRLLAGMGDDVILGGSNTDVIVGNGGNDWLGGGAGSDILAAGSGDVASSGSNPDNIFGNVGSDYESTIVGGAGDDTLVAIEGDVIATGGEGTDTFAFYGAQAGLQTHLTITDFEIGTDRIDVSNLGISAGDLTTYLNDYLTDPESDPLVEFDLSALTSDTSDSIKLTIQKASITPTGNSESEPTEVTGNALKAALSDAISTSFETTSGLSDAWVLDLAPLVYPSAP